ncbi:hypothetical protein SELMODRAFT_19046, partial [Selaginella moellendorffii]
MQKDCNLVYYTSANFPVWDTKTNGLDFDCKLRMQLDGNLVLYGAFNQKARWSSKTYCIPLPNCLGDSIFIIQEDHTLVLY